jgi:hypothetical protein
VVARGKPSRGRHPASTSGLSLGRKVDDFDATVLGSRGAALFFSRALPQPTRGGWTRTAGSCPRPESQWGHCRMECRGWRWRGLIGQLFPRLHRSDLAGEHFKVDISFDDGLLLGVDQIKFELIASTVDV